MPIDPVKQFRQIYGMSGTTHEPKNQLERDVAEYNRLAQKPHKTPEESARMKTLAKQLREAGYKEDSFGLMRPNQIITNGRNLSPEEYVKQVQQKTIDIVFSATRK